MLSIHCVTHLAVFRFEIVCLEKSFTVYQADTCREAHTTNEANFTCPLGHQTSIFTCPRSTFICPGQWNLGFFPAGLKCRSQVRSQVTGHRAQVRSQVRLQATGHRSGHRSHIKTIGQWTKLFWTDVLLYKNEISQGTLMIFLSFKQY